MPDHILRVGFSGWDDSTTQSSELAPGETRPDFKSPVFQNMRLRPGKAIQRRGQAPISSTVYPPDIQLLYWTRLTGRKEYLVLVASGSVYDAYTGAVLTGGADRFTRETECNAAWLDGRVIIGSGLDPNVAFDGAQVYQLTVDPCSGQAIGLTAGAAGSPDGTYQYLCVFLNHEGIEGDFLGTVAAAGTVPLSDYPSITVANEQVELTNLPLCPAGQDCTGRRLYRTKDGGTLFYLLTTIDDNTTTTATDNTADSDLGIEFEGFPDTTLKRSQRSPFPPCRYLESHQGRLFGAGNYSGDSNARTIHYSDDLDPTCARTVTYPDVEFQGGRVVLSDRAAGEITGISDSFGAQLVIFTGGEAYQWTGTDNENFQAYPWAMHGCVSHRTIAHYQNQLLFLAADGLYSYTGSQAAVFAGSPFARVSEAVRNTIESLSAADLAEASAVVQDGRYYLFTPSVSLVIDLLYGGAWYTDEPNRFAHATVSLFTRETRQRIYAVGSDSKVWQLETGTSDNGEPIPCRVRTPDIALAGSQLNARPIRYGGLFRACADTVSGSLIIGTAQSIFTDVVDLTIGQAGWNGATYIPFDTATSPLNTVRQRTIAPAEALSDTHALAFSCDAGSGEFELLEGTFEYEGGGGWNG